MKEEISDNIYFIPKNITGDFLIPYLNIRVNKRKFAEGVVLSFFGLLLAKIFPYVNKLSMYSAMLLFGTLGLIIGSFGINNEPISVFLRTLFKFLRRRDVMLYNPNIKNIGGDNASSGSSVYSSFLLTKRKLDEGTLKILPEYEIKEPDLCDIKFREDIKKEKKKKK